MIKRLGYESMIEIGGSKKILGHARLGYVRLVGYVRLDGYFRLVRYEALMDEGGLGTFESANLSNC